MKRSRPSLRIVKDCGVASPFELQAIADEMAQRRRDAPQVTIEALVFAYRAGGIKALEEPANRERLSRLSPVQIEQLRARLKQIKSTQR